MMIDRIDVPAGLAIVQLFRTAFDEVVDFFTHSPCGWAIAFVVIAIVVTRLAFGPPPGRR